MMGFVMSGKKVVVCHRTAFYIFSKGHFLGFDITKKSRNVTSETPTPKNQNVDVIKDKIDL